MLGDLWEVKQMDGEHIVIGLMFSPRLLWLSGTLLVLSSFWVACSWTAIAEHDREKELPRWHPCVMGNVSSPLWIGTSLMASCGANGTVRVSYPAGPQWLAASTPSQQSSWVSRMADQQNVTVMIDHALGVGYTEVPSNNVWFVGMFVGIIVVVVCAVWGGAIVYQWYTSPPEIDESRFQHLKEPVPLYNNDAVREWGNQHV